jgi:hypothetical protein
MMPVFIKGAISFQLKAKRRNPNTQNKRLGHPEAPGKIKISSRKRRKVAKNVAKIAKENHLASGSITEASRSQVQDQQPENKHRSFEVCGPGVERVKLPANGIVYGERTDFSDWSSQRIHAGNDLELRDCG